MMLRMRVQLRNRRGATIILIGVAMVMMIGLMAFAVDFGRMYAFRAQVHTASDAAALAGARVLDTLNHSGTGADIQTVAIAAGQRNQVNQATPSIPSSAIEPYIWNFGTNTGAPAANWTTAGVNAVRATATHSAPYIFGPFFGIASRVRSTTSVAAVGSVGATDCVRPWAVPYQVMLDILYPPAGTRNALTYNLTAQDVATLSAMTYTSNFLLKIGNATSGVVSGNFYAVRLPPHEYFDGTQGNPWSGGSTYRDALGYTCAQLATAIAGQTTRPFISVGDWLEPENGNMTGPTGSGVADLCQLAGNGGTTPPGANGNQSFTCNQPVSVKMALWANVGNAPNYPSGCGGKCFQVKYLGVFAITGYDKNNGVYGYFSSLLSSGQFMGVPGPVKRLALVQ